MPKYLFTGIQNEGLRDGISDLQIRVFWNIIFFFSAKTYVVGAQKNCLNEMVLLSTQNIFFN